MPVVLVNTDYISGKTVETVGMVYGTRASFFGTEDDNTKMAIDRMIWQANQLGADGIVNVRFSNSWAYAVVSGTAVKFVQQN